MLGFILTNYSVPNPYIPLHLNRESLHFLTSVELGGCLAYFSPLLVAVAEFLIATTCVRVMNGLL